MGCSVEYMLRWLQRRDFKDSSGAKVTNLFSLVDIWTPLMGEVCCAVGSIIMFADHTQIRTLLRDYITNDEALSSARNPIVSIQEILRDGRPARSRDKVCAISSLFRSHRVADTTCSNSSDLPNPTAKPPPNYFDATKTI